ncbi:MAG: GTPase ObgE [Patescibacteria group bacterium]
MLVDNVEITIKSGKGGDGIVAWRREKHVPLGGPDGGDGGRGGSVYLLSDNNVDTLSSFRYRKVFSAEDGQRGMSKKKHGRSADDLILSVPVGTLVTDAITGQLVFDFTQLGQKYRLARGGDGGLGNPHFAHATNQKPEEFTPGKPGITKQLRLELKLIADVALIGQPNAGKSSIINCLTEAHSRVGAFAFSTREPVLGAMDASDNKIILVDLPGLLEGAHKGKGLGDEFLKHAQRVRAIIHVIDATQPNPQNALDQIKNELIQYDEHLSTLPTLIVLNKIDLLSQQERKTIAKKFPEALMVSAETKEGIDTLRRGIIKLAS